MSEVDSNNDGKISYDEFYAQMMKVIQKNVTWFISLNSEEIVNVHSAFVLLSPNVEHADRDDWEGAF